MKAVYGAFDEIKDIEEPIPFEELPPVLKKYALMVLKGKGVDVSDSDGINFDLSDGL